ncbi:NAD(P)H-dependent glycerol-3-phosphate dehydrogenase [Catalinimonas sp. 4WD22]|uniref:NAD(P)H-dependent glycerol-3-phosphate dehydrogenase n=1 Tax=Catalinimonas locisalis TaxID=3133978 RepID=UPI0031010EAD
MSKQYVGVVGAGSFGTVIANILAENVPVLLYARRNEVVDEMHAMKRRGNYSLHENVHPTNDLEQLAKECQVIFPIVSSSGFRDSISDLSPYLKPYHILIHGTKGLDVDHDAPKPLTRESVRTMSEVIQEESVVVRVGCLAGPNLAKELAEGQPGATVVASHFDEVIQIGQQLLRNPRFQVYGNNDLIGIELCGILKNIIAIASGALSGLGLGENSRALLISRGMVEMIYLGKALGGNIEAFIGLAGVGDLVATCFSKHSRNYTVGYRLAQGETLTEIMQTMEELAEGVNTTKIVKQLADYYDVSAPITRMLYKVLFEDLPVEKALDSLMKIPFTEDVGFL